MAEYKFYLKDKNSAGPTPIRLHIHYSNMICKLYIGEKVNPIYWKETKKGSRVYKVSKEHPNYEQLNLRLSTIANDSERVYANFKDANNQEPTPDKLKELVLKKIKPDAWQKETLFTYFQQIIDSKIKDAERRGVGKRNTVIPTYELTLADLKEFQKKKRFRVDFDSINMKFYNSYIEFMTDKGLKRNTQGTRLKYVKAVLRQATAEGINTNLAFTNNAFKSVSEKVEAIYLNETELRDLYTLELNDTQGKVRDLFLISAYTGLRISDVKRITGANIEGNPGGRFIRITTQKTGAGVVIPVYPMIEQIFLKYDYNLPVFSDQHINRTLKDIGPILAEKTESVVLGANGKDKSKYDKIRSHTGRRSFCTNMYLRGVKPATIMKISAHKTEKEFFKYIKVTPDENAQILNGYFENDRELYANGTTLNIQ